MNKILKKLIHPFYRAPSFVIGDDGRVYLHRWWVIPKNKWFNIYLHKFLNDDDDRALHDHPWPSLSIILRGGYIEHLPGGVKKEYKPGSFIYRRADHAHRVELFKNTRWIRRTEPGLRYYDDETDAAGYPLEPVKSPRPAVTIFITGPKVREWGFRCPQGWRHWKEFVSKHDEGKTVKGCAE